MRNHKVPLPAGGLQNSQIVCHIVTNKGVFILSVSSRTTDADVRSLFLANNTTTLVQTDAFGALALCHALVHASHKLIVLALASFLSLL